MIDATQYPAKAVRVYTSYGPVFDIVRSRKLIVCSSGAYSIAPIVPMNENDFEDHEIFASMSPQERMRSFVENLTFSKFKNNSNKIAIPYHEIGPIFLRMPFWISWPEAPCSRYYTTPVHLMTEIKSYHIGNLEIDHEIISCPVEPEISVAACSTKGWHNYISASVDV